MPGQVNTSAAGNKRYDRPAIIAANPLLDYCRARGWVLRRDGPRWKCLCPFRDERTPSFTVYPDNHFYCFSCGRKGSVIDLHMALRGIGVREAMAELSAGGGGQVAGAPSAPKYDPLADEEKASQRRRNWPTFETPTPAEIATIAERRDLSPESVAIAVERGLLFCADWRDNRAWVVTDGARIVAQARRMDGGLWACGKAQSLPGSTAGWPVGAREAAAHPAIALAEGSGDFLAAFHLAWCSGVENSTSIVAVLGAQARIAPAALPLFAGKRVRIFAHDDASGYAGTARWAAQLKAAGARVDAFSFTGFRQSNGAKVNDLNDFARLDYDQWEAERALVESAFSFVPTNPSPQ